MVEQSGDVAAGMARVLARASSSTAAAALAARTRVAEMRVNGLHWLELTEAAEDDDEPDGFVDAPDDDIAPASTLRFGLAAWWCASAAAAASCEEQLVVQVPFLLGNLLFLFFHLNHE